LERSFAGLAELGFEDAGSATEEEEEEEEEEDEDEDEEEEEAKEEEDEEAICAAGGTGSAAAGVAADDPTPSFTSFAGEPGIVDREGLKIPSVALEAKTALVG